MTRKPLGRKEERVWVAAVLDCQGAITLLPTGTNLGLGLTVTAKHAAIPYRVYQLCRVGKPRNIHSPKSHAKHVRWNVFGRKARELLELIEVDLFVAKKTHVSILHNLFKQLMDPEIMDVREVRGCLIKFNKLSDKGYLAKKWPERVNRFIVAVKDSGKCTY